MNTMTTATGDRQATWSLVLGLSSVLCACLLGIPGAILGALALRNASPSGRKRAWIGMATGSLFSIAWVVLILISIG